MRAKKRTDAWTGRQTDRQTDVVKLMVAFQNFANAPKKITSARITFISVLGTAIIDWLPEFMYSSHPF
jgi:hypothetical protein